MQTAGDVFFFFLLKRKHKFECQNNNITSHFFITAKAARLCFLNNSYSDSNNNYQ